MSPHRAVSSIILGLIACLAVAMPARAQWSMTANDGKSVFNIGFLAQSQVEVL